MATFLHGAVKQEKFHIWTGCGGNGKSKLIDLFQNCFRDYCCPLPVTHLTKERGRSEGANSALATTKNKRFVVLQEPESNEELKVGELKMLTGGDTVPVRDLYKKQEYIKPQFKMVLTCNALPGLSSTDRGVWRRLSVVEFISVFTDNPDPNEKYQFMILLMTQDEKKHLKMQNIKLFSINQNLTKILIYLKNFKEFNIILQNLRLI